MTPDLREAFKPSPIALPLPVAAKRLNRIAHHTDADTALAMARVDKSKRYCVGPLEAVYVNRDTLARLVEWDKSPVIEPDLSLRLKVYKLLKERAANNNPKR